MIQVNYNSNENLLKKKNCDRKDFIVGAFPYLIGKDLKITNRSIDFYITPFELIHNNFNSEEIVIIRSDPEYFKLDFFEKFKKLDILKTKTLLEIFDEEDKICDSKSQNKNIKSSFAGKKISINFTKEKR